VIMKVLISGFGALASGLDQPWKFGMVSVFVIKFCIIYHNMGFCAKKGKWILHMCILLVDVA
jgi:hypothetical protein